MQSDAHDDASATRGAVALSLLEAIILTLRDTGLLSEAEIDDAFVAAIDAHADRAEGSGEDAAFHGDVRDALRRLRTHGNAVRLPTRVKTTGG